MINVIQTFFVMIILEHTTKPFIRQENSTEQSVLVVAVKQKISKNYEDTYKQII